MIKVLFICLGNICRSPMAEFVLKDMVKKRGISDEFVIASAGTSGEELGNGVHPGTRQRLLREGISCEGKNARQLVNADKYSYDYFLCMDESNLLSASRILQLNNDERLRLLLSFTDNPRNIADPWYTNNFNDTYNDIKQGCEIFLSVICADK